LMIGLVIVARIWQFYTDCSIGQGSQSGPSVWHISLIQ
jgi:hypothetical protein